MKALELAVIMPVFNEEESLAQVVGEWIPHLKTTAINFRLYLLNDGSCDNTAAMIKTLQAKHQPYIETFSHANRGHGQTCIVGYEKALVSGAQWILQIDSDGQCDPQYFENFWHQRAQHALIFGYRFQRQDGLPRFLISRVLALTCWLGFGIWVKDPNVPYRLMAAHQLRAVLSGVPGDFYLANILLSLLLRKNHAIHWIPIKFRNRFGGSPAVKLRSFARHGYRLFLHLLRLRFL